MALTQSGRLEVADASAIAAARGLTRRLAAEAGLDGDRLSSALIVASELATNLVVHAGRGTFAARARPGELVLLTWDAGPGIRDVEAARQDGFSTAGTAGTGLGAIHRLSRQVDVRSVPDRATVVVARLGDPSAPTGRFCLDGLTLPLAGEGPSGDAWGARQDGEVLTVLLADGLGHGPDAAVAADAAVACLVEPSPPREPKALLQAAQAALGRTRGAAVAVARLDLAAGEVRFCGVGNVAGVLASPAGRRTLVSQHGIVGRPTRTLREQVLPCSGEDVLVLHTDGVREGAELGADRGLLRADPLVVAATLVLEHERGRDDVGVLVAREAR